MSNVAIYPGSFDPFTYGHLDIVEKSAKLFDKVYVVIAVNSNKKRSYVDTIMKAAIEASLVEHNIVNCEVVVFDGLIGEFIKEHDIKYMVRGLRNNMDYNYEENIAEVNKLINPDIEYVYFRAERVGVSSSMVKELATYGQDVSKYVPKEVLKVITDKVSFDKVLGDILNPWRGKS